MKVQLNKLTIQASRSWKQSKILLADDDIFKSLQASIETNQGTVPLSGFVNAQKAVNKADEIVRSVKGVRSIKNNLIVK